MNMGEQMKLTFERNLEPVESLEEREQRKAREYLENPKRKEVFEAIFEKYGNRSKGAKGDVEEINKIVGFPMAFVIPGKPEIINYMTTDRIQEFINSRNVKEAA